LVVSDVVVVTGLDTVVWLDVVVVVVSGVVAQAQSDSRPAMTRNGRMSFFMCMFVYWTVTRQSADIMTAMALRPLWGVAHP
jgi:hypothetical protein